MSLRVRMKDMLQSAEHVPGLKRARDAYFERRFRNWPGAFLGVYQSFAEAAAAAPKGGRVGYDYEEFGGIYDDRLFRIMPWDYPILFWLGKIGMQNKRVFDFGGHIGLAFYGFERYLDIGSDMRWTVYDLPKVIASARQFAARNPRPQLAFTTSVSDARGHDVFHASGSLQYLEKPLPDQLVELELRPQHLLINKLPLSTGSGFATLQNTFHAYNPYAIFHRDTFLAGLTKLGYELVDEWLTPGVGCVLLDRPERNVPEYTGLYLRLSAR